MPARSVPVSPTFVTVSEHEVWLRAVRQLDGSCARGVFPVSAASAVSKPQTAANATAIVQTCRGITPMHPSER